jgi:hypothetical protein
MELTDRIIPRAASRAAGWESRRSYGRRARVPGCASGLLRFDDVHWLPAAPMLVGYLFPRLLGQPSSLNRDLAARSMIFVLL